MFKKLVQQFRMKDGGRLNDISKCLMKDLWVKALNKIMKDLMFSMKDLYNTTMRFHYTPERFLTTLKHHHT